MQNPIHGEPLHHESELDADMRKKFWEALTQVTIKSDLMIEKETSDENKYSIYTTHNGREWSGLSCLTIDEIEQVHSLLDDFLRNR